VRSLTRTPLHLSASASASRRVTLALVGVLAGGAALGVGPHGGVSPAAAQIADALGRPLPSPDLPVGTIMVRIVAGNPGAPVAGTDVTLIVAGEPRIARTDAAGRATFAGLTPGATVQAKVTADGKDVTSHEFQVADSGGARVMMTTKPWNMSGAAGAAGPAGGEGGGAAGPMMGGGGGMMPDPRQLSGEPRPEQADAAGSITVRVTYDDLKDPSPPVGLPVTLVGYAADDTVVVVTKPTDEQGRVTWTDLDRSGGTSYFAMTLVPRGTAFDRVVSSPILLDAEVGVRLILSADKRTSTAPSLDDLAKLDKQEGAFPAGTIRVGIEGVPVPDMAIELVDASTGQVLTKGVAGAAPEAAELTGAVTFVAKPDVPVGTVDVRVVGVAAGDDGAGQPVPGAEVSISPVGATAPGAVSGKPALTSKTSPSGEVRMAMPGPGAFIATITINGKALRSEPFELAKSGGQLQVRATMPSAPRPQALLTLAARQGQVVYAQGRGRNELYRSLPFQPVAEHGTSISIYVYPRILFSFSLTSSVDDQFLGVQGRFEVKNYSFIPYRAGPDGMVLPLPARFKGAVVANQDQREVAVDQGNGFRIMRPIPPGGRGFQGGFSLPVEGGEVHWELELPLGAFQSGMEILATPGMTVDPPPGVTVEDGEGADHRVFKVLPQIQILPKQAMVMTVGGLPHTAAWKLWAPRWAGLLALIMMSGGLAYALWPKGVGARKADRARAVRRAQLLDELVELDRAGKDNKRRAQVLAELEQVWESTSSNG
jgi:hypothetical protein